MLRKILVTVFVLLSFVLVHGILETSAQTQQIEKPLTPAAPFSALNLEISVSSTSVLSLQPVPIGLKLKNNSNLAAMGYTRIAFGTTPLWIYVTKAGTNNAVLIDMLSPIHKFTDVINVPLVPSQEVESRELLTLGLAKYFPETGDYEIHAVLGNADRTRFIESNRITISIQEPVGPNRLAYNFIKTTRTEDYLFSGSEFDKVENILHQITTLYPDSPYAQNASFVLGENYFYDRNYPLALANLVRLENDDEFVFAEKVRKYLVEIRRSQLLPNQEQ